MRSSSMSASGTVSIRWVKPLPVVVPVTVRSAPTSRSFANVVLTAVLLALVPAPLPAAATSSGAVVAIPPYSAMRISA